MLRLGTGKRFWAGGGLAAGRPRGFWEGLLGSGRIKRGGSFSLLLPARDGKSRNFNLTDFYNELDLIMLFLTWPWRSSFAPGHSSSRNRRPAPSANT